MPSSVCPEGVACVMPPGGENTQYTDKMPVTPTTNYSSELCHMFNLSKLSEQRLQFIKYYSEAPYCIVTLLTFTHY